MFSASHPAMELASGTTQGELVSRPADAKQVSLSEGFGEGTLSDGRAFYIEEKAEYSETATGGNFDWGNPAEFRVTQKRDMVKKTLLPQRKKVMAEHSALVDKRFTEGLSSKEERRLKMVRWNIDQIEDALVGDSLDHLEKHVSSQIALRTQIDSLASQIRSLSSK